MTEDEIIGYPFRLGGTWYMRKARNGDELVELITTASVFAEISTGMLTVVHGVYVYTNREGVLSFQVSHAEHPTEYDADLDHGINIDPRKIVEAEVSKKIPNWRLIEAASREFVDDDPDRVRFSVDAAHIQRLGEQLVSKQETALSELIKNAYDADATKVTLTFSNQDKIGGSLVIEDDGVGMTEEVIRSSWMRISTNAKDTQPTSPVFGRARAGKKGIGRFSVQRLGKRLTFVSKPAGEGFGYRVQFDWDRDFIAGASLQDVFSSIERFAKPTEDQGTRLQIDDLRERWSAADIEKVWRAVVLLQPPFPVGTDDTHALLIGDYRADPGFKVEINDVTQEAQRELFSIEKSFLSQALATIRARIDETGLAALRVTSEKLQLDETAEYHEKLLLTGPVKLEARYFIYNSASLSGMSAPQATRMGREFGGIRIYRNGFRVQPYGDPADDWLQLAGDTSRRNILVPANNSNFFGQVSIPPLAESLFEETSSREGLIENEAFLELREFTRWAVEWAALRIASVRKRKTKASERNFVPEQKKPSEVLRDFRERLITGQPDKNVDEDVNESFAEAEQLIVEYERVVEQQRAASIEYEEMLRILASLGISIGVFGHEIKGSQGALVSNLHLLNDLVAEAKDPILKPKLLDQHAELQKAVGRVFDIGGYIAGLLSQTESRELHELSVGGAVQRFVAQFKNYMTKQGVEFLLDISPPSLRTTAMHSAEFDAVLLNFLTNAVKSMKRAKAHPKKIKISARKIDRDIVLAFEDNGTGLEPGIEDRIFDPFFTTSASMEEDGIAGPGTGLGLKIVSDIAESYGGSVTVATPSQGYNFKIEFRILSK
ncbi:ATP-binding protein [Shinella sp. BE166]|uniref:ATP-binding protein n=1 Tax=Shinella sp. BE166 TaxID=3373918 RepID=UPI003EBA9B35